MLAVAVLFLWLLSETHGVPVQKQNEVLRPARLAMIPQAKVVLANTRKNGSPTWGLTVNEAEQACQAIAEAETFKLETGRKTPGENMMHPFLGRLYNVTETEPDREVRKVQGHLLSIENKLELAAVIEALRSRKHGVYWTGARLVRRPSENATQGLNQPQARISWTDGSSGSPEVLGLSAEDIALFEPNDDYCLAFDLWLGRWQARCCHDRLAYACKIRSLLKAVEDYPTEGGSSEIGDLDGNPLGNHLRSTEGQFSPPAIADSATPTVFPTLDAESTKKHTTLMETNTVQPRLTTLTKVTEEPNTMADSTTPSVFSTRATESLATQLTPMEIHTVQTTSTASTKVTGLSDSPTPLSTIQSSIESSESTSTAPTPPVTETTPKNTYPPSLSEDEADLQGAETLVTAVNAQPISDEFTSLPTDSEATTTTGPQMLTVSAFDKTTATTSSSSTSTTVGSSSEVSFTTPINETSTVSSSSTPMASSPAQGTPFMTTGSQTKKIGSEMHKSTAAHTSTMRPSGVSVFTDASQASTLSVTDAAATTTSNLLHSSTFTSAETANIKSIRSSSAPVCTEPSQATTLSLTDAADSVTTAAGSALGHAESTESTATNTIKSDLEDPSKVGIKEAGLTSVPVTSSEGLLPSPSSTNNPLQNSDTIMTTSEMLLSTTGEMSSGSTVGSTPIVEGTVGVSNVHPATMVTSTMPLSSAAYTRNGSAVESFTLVLKATTLAMAKAADIGIAANITSREPVTPTSSMPGQVRPTMIDAPSTLADLPGDVGHISWLTGVLGGSSELGTIPSPATPLSTNSKVTGAVEEVTQPTNSATLTSTLTVKEITLDMLKEKTTTTDVASADIAEPTVGRQTNRLKKSVNDFTTPNVELTVSSQMTTSTQKELDAPTAALNPSRASASPAFSEPSPVEVGQTTPVPATTVSYQTGWAVAEVAGTLEGEHSTKEGQHSTLTIISLPAYIIPVKKSNSLLHETSPHPAQIAGNSQTAA